jgi:hypothetical protein
VLASRVLADPGRLVLRVGRPGLSCSGALGGLGDICCGLPARGLGVLVSLADRIGRGTLGSGDLARASAVTRSSSAACSATAWPSCPLRPNIQLYFVSYWR